MPPDNKPGVEIVDYDDRYGDAFARLNAEWLEKYFVIEPIDRLLLSDPRRSIIEPGGAVLYACIGEHVVGTAAVKRAGDGIFELTKMAVTSSHQGRGIGRLLLCAAIDRFHQMGGQKLYLESNSALAPALALYESAGFRHESPPDRSDYARADVFMVYRPNDVPGS